MLMNEWQPVGLSSNSFEGEVLVELEGTVRESEHFGELGVKLLQLVMTSCPSSAPFESCQITTQSDCCMVLYFILGWVCSAFCRCFFPTLPLLFSWFHFFSAAWQNRAQWPREEPSIGVRPLVAINYVALPEPSQKAFHCPWRSAFECLVDMPLRTQ